MSLLHQKILSALPKGFRILSHSLVQFLGMGSNVMVLDFLLFSIAVIAADSAPENAIERFVAPTEFVVEFDIGPVGGVNGTIVPRHLRQSEWTTVGNSRGSNLSNQTGGQIAAIWMQVPDGSHTFQLGASGGGKAFGKVWRKKDGTELLFLDGQIPQNSIFWNRVVPRNVTTPFLGQAFHPGQNPAPPTPDPSEWDLIESNEEDVRTVAWKGFTKKLSRCAPTVRTYAELEDDSRIVWLSEVGFPYVYDADMDEIYGVAVDRMYPFEADHIVAAKNEKNGIDVVIEKTGVEVARGSWDPDSRITARKEFEVGSRNHDFSIDGVENPTVRVKKGTQVKIILTSQGGTHDWVFALKNGTNEVIVAQTPRVMSGAPAVSVEFVADTVGEHVYYCSVGTHRAQGMEGKLIVEE
jgi:plastocyanin